MKYEGAALNSTLATLNHFSLFQKYLFKKSGLNTKEGSIICGGKKIIILWQNIVNWSSLKPIWEQKL